MSSLANGRSSLSGGAGRSATVFGHGRRGSAGSTVLFNAYENEEALGLTRLDDDEYDEDVRDTSPMIRQGKTHASRAADAQRAHRGSPNGSRASGETTARAQRQYKRQSLIDDSTPNFESGR